MGDFLTKDDDEKSKGHVTEFLFFSMPLSNVFTVLNTLYIVFCMFLLIRSSFVSSVCEVLSTLRAGDHRGRGSLTAPLLLCLRGNDTNFPSV